MAMAELRGVEQTLMKQKPPDTCKYTAQMHMHYTECFPMAMAELDYYVRAQSFQPAGRISL